MIIDYSGIRPKFKISFKLEDLDKSDKARLLVDLLREFKIMEVISKSAVKEVIAAFEAHMEEI